MKPNITTKTAVALTALAAFLAGCESPTEQTTASTSTPSSPAAGLYIDLRAGAPDLSELRPPSEPLDRERYQHLEENTVKLVAEAPVSTFSVDVDTGSYSNVRRFLDAGQLPPRRRGAHRGAGQLLRLRLPGRQRTGSSPSP